MLLRRKRKAKFEVFHDASDEWRWRLKAANGEIVAQSEGYTLEKDARRGAEAARVAARRATAA